MTFYESDNYGTCLQAWALAETISKLGYECKILRFNRNEVNNKKQSKLDRIRQVGIKQALDIIVSRKAISEQKKAFQKFRKHLPITEERYTSILSLKDAAAQYDAFVCGSDMIWSWESKAYLDAYFLKFAPKYKRIAYAPSFGNTNFSNEMKTYYSTALESIDYCSCREKKGAQFVKEITSHSCKFVLDPTMLLSESEWRAKYRLPKCIYNNKKIILCYLFGNMNSKFKNSLCDVMKKDEEVRYIPGNAGQYFHEYIRGKKAFGPIEFLESYSSANVIITNTYHGLVFALIFKKPFILLHRENREHWAKHEERMSSLLEQFGLLDRYINVDNKLSRDLFSLDYSTIQPQIEVQKKDSMNYLVESLLKATNS